MSDWIHNLPVPSMALVIFGFTYLRSQFGQMVLSLFASGMRDLQAACELIVIALVYCDNRLASSIALGLFATGVATSVLLIAAHDRPFTGQISVGSGPLLQIMPGEAAKS